MKASELNIGDIIQKTQINIHTDKKEEIIQEYKIDRVTKKYAFSGLWKFKRHPEYDNIYLRCNGVDIHYIFFKLKKTL